jgi:predicted nucleotidyltransferase/HEPN domain-containing protein
VRKDYDHLTRQQQLLLERGVTIIREQFVEAIKGKAWEKKKQGRILKIILYGSMARGKAVRDLGSGYRSDFDLLIVVSHFELTDQEWWYGVYDGLTLEQSLGATRYPYSFIVHDLADVNDQLHRGRPFFTDINRDGIIVYEYDTKALAKPGNLGAEESHDEAQSHFEQWFENSIRLKRGADFFVADGSLKQAAFLLHQTVESAYHCALLTLRLYSPQLHDLKQLRGMAEGLDPRLIEAWPRKTRWQRRPFERIWRAYVNARYSKHYRITKEDLAAAMASVRAASGNREDRVRGTVGINLMSSPAQPGASRACRSRHVPSGQLHRGRLRRPCVRGCRACHLHHSKDSLPHGGYAARAVAGPLQLPGRDWRWKCWRRCCPAHRLEQ